MNNVMLEVIKKFIKDLDDKDVENVHMNQFKKDDGKVTISIGVELKEKK